MLRVLNSKVGGAVIEVSAHSRLVSGLDVAQESGLVRDGGVVMDMICIDIRPLDLSSSQSPLSPPPPFLSPSDIDSI